MRVRCKKVVGNPNYKRCWASGGHLEGFIKSVKQSLIWLRKKGDNLSQVKTSNNRNNEQENKSNPGWRCLLKTFTRDHLSGSSEHFCARYETVPRSSNILTSNDKRIQNLTRLPSLFHFWLAQSQKCDHMYTDNSWSLFTFSSFSFSRLVLPGEDKTKIKLWPPKSSNSFSGTRLSFKTKKPTTVTQEPRRGNQSNSASHLWLV